MNIDEVLDSLLSNVKKEANRERVPEFDAKKATAPIVAFVHELTRQGFTREEAMYIFCSMMGASRRVS